MKATYFTMEEGGGRKGYWVFTPDLKIAFSKEHGIVKDAQQADIPQGVELSVHKAKLDKITKYLELNDKAKEINDELLKLGNEVDHIIDEIFAEI